MKANRKKRVGLVIRKKMAKSAVVELERLIKHPYYHKRFKRTSRLTVDDQKIVIVLKTLPTVLGCFILMPMKE